MELPSGTVNFLFTDIEGSTRLWEQQPEAMSPALARHDSLMRTAIESNGGTIFKTIGDAFCAVFPTAPQALEAAVAAQQSLQRVSTEVGIQLTLNVRMALHTGTAEQREGDYFGSALNRVSRLLAIGHGQQVLLSHVVHDLSCDTLPTAVTLKSLGSHRLRDLSRPEFVFQVCHPELPTEFPPLTSLDNPELPNNLPQQVTSFIGREKEIAEVKELLSRTRLLSLTGSGGCGKTRLCLHVAVDELHDNPDGVWMIGLAPLTDPALVARTVAQVLRIAEEPGKSLLDTLAQALRSKRMLLLLDNCEHLLSACARLADFLIQACPTVKIIASSRECLNVSGEVTYRVPSLSAPPRNQAVNVRTLMRYEAALLFLERAQVHQPSFTLTDRSAKAVAHLCHQLDGIPLAIELAAARLRSLSIDEINGKLDQRFRLLTGGSRTALPRQQTLRALIDWSYDLLNEQERRLFRRLAIFAGGWTMAAAEEVCNGGEIDAWEILDLLTSLADKSLVVPDYEDGLPRYRLLETVRQYAWEKLTESGELDLLRLRHRDFYLAFAERVDPQLRSPDHANRLNRLEREHDNLRAALETSTPDEMALRIAGALWRFWYVRGYYSEGRERLAGILASAATQTRGKYRGEALNGAGALAWSQGDYEEARRSHEESLAIYREIADKQGISYSLTHLGNAACYAGDYRAAGASLEESLALQRELGDERGLAYSLAALGQLVSGQGDYAAAKTFLEESLSISRKTGNKQGIASSLASFATVVLYQGDSDQAYTFVKESLNLQQELGDKRGIAHSLETFAALAVTQGQGERGPCLWGAAQALREAIAAPSPHFERGRYARYVAEGRTAISSDAFSAAWAAGRVLTIDEAISIALAGR